RPAALLVRRRRADRRGRPPAPLSPASVVRALGALAARPRADPGGPGRDPRPLRRAPGARRRRVDADADLRRRGAAEPGRRLADGAHRRGDRRHAGARGVVGRGRHMKKYKDIAGDGGSNIVAQVEAQQARLRERLATVRAVVAIVSGKGGVGKSSLTANLACCLAQGGLRVGVLDADLNGPTMAKMLGVRGQRLVLASGGVEPPRTDLGVKVMSMDLLLPSDAAPLEWIAVTQAEAHTWRGAMEASALREFFTDTNWGELDLLLLDLPPGTDRLVTVASLVERLTGAVVVTIPSDVSHLVVRKSITVASQVKVPVLGLV